VGNNNLSRWYATAWGSKWDTLGEESNCVTTCFQSTQFLPDRIEEVFTTVTANRTDSGVLVAAVSTLLLSRDHYLKGNVYKLLFLYPSSARKGKKGSGSIKWGWRNVILVSVCRNGAVSKGRRSFLPLDCNITKESITSIFFFPFLLVGGGVVRSFVYCAKDTVRPSSQLKYTSYHLDPRMRQWRITGRNG